MKCKKEKVGSEYAMAYCVLQFIAGVRKIISQLVCAECKKLRLSSTSAKAAAAVEDVSITNGFVTVLFTGGWVGVWIVFCRLVN